MRKKIIILFIAALAAFQLAGCGEKSWIEEETSGDIVNEEPDEQEIEEPEETDYSLLFGEGSEVYENSEEMQALKTVQATVLSAFEVDAEDGKITFINSGLGEDTASIYIIALDGDGVKYVRGIQIYDSNGEKLPQQYVKPDTVYDCEDAEGNPLKIYMVRAAGEIAEDISILAYGSYAQVDAPVVYELDKWAYNSQSEDSHEMSVVALQGSYYLYLAKMSSEQTVPSDDGTFHYVKTNSIILLPLNGLESELSEDDFVLCRDIENYTDSNYDQRFFVDFSVSECKAEEGYSSISTLNGTQIMISLTASFNYTQDEAATEGFEAAWKDGLNSYMSEFYLSCESGIDKTNEEPDSNYLKADIDHEINSEKEDNLEDVTEDDQNMIYLYFN